MRIPLGKASIHWFSLQLWLSSGTDKILLPQPGSRFRRKTLNSNQLYTVKKWTLCYVLFLVEGLEKYMNTWIKRKAIALNVKKEIYINLWTDHGKRYRNYEVTKQKWQICWTKREDCKWWKGLTEFCSRNNKQRSKRPDRKLVE